MENKTARIKELIEILNRASEAYYNEDIEIMPNIEYDRLYDELVILEEETGVKFSNSPTANVGYEVSEVLEKERHESPMLSLGKTKDREALAAFLGDREGLLSWKLDGLTVVVTYENGEISKAVTRGNGEVGEVVTANAKTFVNIPLNIAYKGRLVVRGEAVIKYSDFERINNEIEDGDARYKNPRNLCSGAVRQLDPAITAKRCVNFYPFSLESAEDIDFKNSNEEKFKWLLSQGFQVVPYKRVNARTVVDAVGEYAKEIETFDVPSDGLVMLLDDIAYGKSLGLTSKFPRNAIAFKWQDELAGTVLKEIEWSPSRTGLINPVAIFEPVELEGTTVSRASLHNISIIEGLKLGIGDEITVYKANMIIPQIAENLTGSNNIEIPTACPACGGEAVIKNDAGVKTLVCVNPECPAKKIKTFANFVSRDCMNIDGISEETLEKFISLGIIKDFADLYKLEDHVETIVSIPGYGKKAFNNLKKAVEASKKTTCARLLASLGIPMVGTANAKLIARYFKNDFAAIRNAEACELLTIDGVGDAIAGAMRAYFSDENCVKVIDELLGFVTFEEEVSGEDAEKLAGLTFVITGSLNSYPNRDALKAEIESMGGKVAGSVSAKTSFLINNDVTSTSGKNKKAKELGIEIISEDDYKSRFTG